MIIVDEYDVQAVGSDCSDCGYDDCSGPFDCNDCGGSQDWDCYD